MNAKTRLEQAREGVRLAEAELALMEKVVSAGLPEPYLTSNHNEGKRAIIFSYKVTRESCLDVIGPWLPYKVDGVMEKEPGFCASFHVKKEKERSEVVGETVSAHLKSWQYSTGTDSTLEIFTQFGGYTIALWLDFEPPITQIVARHKHSGKTNKSYIIEYNWEYYGLETGFIPYYKQRGEHGGHFQEWFTALDTVEDFRDVLITHAAKH